VTRVDHAESELTATFGQTEATFDFGELDALQLAYATTIHKSQGSEYPVVVLPHTVQAYTMLGRELIYTAVTRARKLLVIVGSRKALLIAVKRRQPRRWSLLRSIFRSRRGGRGLALSWSEAATSSASHRLLSSKRWLRRSGWTALPPSPSPRPIGWRRWLGSTVPPR